MPLNHRELWFTSFRAAVVTFSSAFHRIRPVALSAVARVFHNPVPRNQPTDCTEKKSRQAPASGHNQTYHTPSGIISYYRMFHPERKSEITGFFFPASNFIDPVSNHHIVHPSSKLIFPNKIQRSFYFSGNLNGCTRGPASLMCRLNLPGT